MDQQQIINELLNALILAQEHLEYCGFGDSWESSIAHEEGLPEKIELAIKNAKNSQI